MKLANRTDGGRVLAEVLRQQRLVIYQIREEMITVVAIEGCIETIERLRDQPRFVVIQEPHCGIDVNKHLRANWRLAEQHDTDAPPLIGALA